ncbi:hypothetical protein BPAE_0549g00010 [Botrytis paeoniae]|uniref:Uncharacterized protein n=1 Tax=Botrytis paeoniae TaxID=278948 RepID=A0A4Z1EW37_9HELO|nr:hypothetical protein BPAE_0549g00010 [Botrytis paeoniae]
MKESNNNIGSIEPQSEEEDIGDTIVVDIGNRIAESRSSDNSRFRGVDALEEEGESESDFEDT